MIRSRGCEINMCETSFALRFALSLEWGDLAGIWVRLISNPNCSHVAKILMNGPYDGYKSLLGISLYREAYRIHSGIQGIAGQQCYLGIE
jgi:hypothetical protein